MLPIKGVNPVLNIIGKQIMEISRGNFDYIGELLPNNDEFNIAITGLNMLSEEIKDITFSKNFFDNIFNSSPDVIFIIDEDGLIQRQNDEARKLQKRLKLTVTHIDYFFDFIKGHNKFNIVRPLLDASKKFYTNEIRIEYNDEIFELKTKKINSKENWYIVILVNITLLKQYQEQLETSEHKYRSIFNLSNNSIFIMTPSGYLIEANASFYKYTGVKKNSREYLGRHISLENVSTIHLARMLINREPIQNMEIIIALKKQRLTALLSLIELNDKNTNQRTYLGILKDVTNLKTEMNINARTISFAQEKIRKQIAFELHDSIGQQLSAIRFMTNSLKAGVKDTRFQENIELISSNILNAIQELRDICFNLMPASLQAHGLENTVREMISRLKSASDKIEFELNCMHVNEKLPLEFAVNAYRIVQEIISNALKHAECSKIVIDITERNKKLYIIIKDNGKGFDYTNLKKLSGTGMKSIQSRVNFYSGVLRMRKSHNFATEYHIFLPLIK